MECPHMIMACSSCTNELCGIIDRPWARFFCSKSQKQKDRESRKEQGAKGKEQRAEAGSQEPSSKEPKAQSRLSLVRWSPPCPPPPSPQESQQPAAASSCCPLPSALKPKPKRQAQEAPAAPSHPLPKPTKPMNNPRLDKAAQSHWILGAVRMEYLSVASGY
jgi:hypothetical protein